MTVRYNYIFPIPESDDVFDEMVRDACSIEWNDPMTQKNGRSGQSQNGLDVFGYPNGPGGRCRGAQSKLRTKGKQLSQGEIDDEIKKAQSSPLNPDQLIIVTSTGRDVALQAYVDQVSRIQTQNNSFSVKIWFWDDLLERLSIERRYILKYYKDIFTSVTNLPEAEALIDKPIYTLIETCDDTSNNPTIIEREMRRRGVSVYRDKKHININGFGPDGVICVYPEIKDKPDDLVMQKFSSVVKNYECSDCPVFAFLPDVFIAKFQEFFLQENGNISKVRILSINSTFTKNISQIFIELLNYGYRRRGALPVIDICCRSLNSLPKSALLDLDWSSEFLAPSDWPDQTLWDSQFTPVINDVVEGVTNLGKNIQIHYDCRLFLPLALALGYHSNIRKLRASVWARSVGCSSFSQKFWDSDSTPAPINIHSEEIEKPAEQTSHMIIEISSQVDIHSEIKGFVEKENLKYGKWLKIDLMEHIRDGVQIDASYAIAYADQVGRIIRQNKGGITDLHLFISTLSPLAFLIGQRLQACGRVHLYWFMNPSYRKAFVLQ